MAGMCWKPYATVLLAATSCVVSLPAPQAWATEFATAIQSVPQQPKQQMVQTASQVFNDMPTDVMSVFANSVKAAMSKLPPAIQQQFARNPQSMDFAQLMQSLTPEQQSSLMSDIQDMRQKLLGAGSMPIAQVEMAAPPPAATMAAPMMAPAALTAVPAFAAAPPSASAWQSEFRGAMQSAPAMEKTQALQATAKVFNDMPGDVMAQFAEGVKAAMAKLPAQAQAAFSVDPSSMDLSRVMATLTPEQQQQLMSDMAQLRNRLVGSMTSVPTVAAAAAAPVQPVAVPSGAPAPALVAPAMATNTAGAWGSEFVTAMESVPKMDHNKMLETTAKVFNDMPTPVMTQFADGVKSTMAKLPPEIQKAFSGDPTQLDFAKVMGSLSPEQQSELMSSVQKMRQQLLGFA